MQKWIVYCWLKTNRATIWAAAFLRQLYPAEYGMFYSILISARGQDMRCNKGKGDQSARPLSFFAASISSIKALTGHTMGAAAAMEAACCVLSLRHQTLIPTWHLDNLLQPCSLDAVRGAVRPARVGYVLNNSAGFGGYNASIILTTA